MLRNVALKREGINFSIFLIDRSTDRRRNLFIYEFKDGIM